MDNKDEQPKRMIPTDDDFNHLLTHTIKYSPKGYPYHYAWYLLHEDVWPPVQIFGRKGKSSNRGFHR